MGSDYYILTNEEKETGVLSEQRASVYAGIPVRIYDIGKFPFGRKVFEKSVLSDVQLEKRCSAFFEAQNSLTRPNLTLKEAKIGAQADEALAVEVSLSSEFALRRGDFMCPDIEVGPLCFEEVSSKYGQSLRRYGVSEGVLQGSGRTVSVIQSDKTREYGVSIKAAHLFTWGRSFSVKSCIAQALGLPMEEIKRTTNSKYFSLWKLLHEVQHAKQIRPVVLADGHRFAMELDADFKTMLSLTQAGVGKSFVPFALFLRTMALLADVKKTPSYMFAPALEAALEGRRLPSRSAITASMTFIQNRLTKEMLEGLCADRAGLGARLIRFWRKTPKTDLDDSYALIRDLYVHKPREVLVPFKDLLERGAFSLTPMTQHLAERIVESARYFNPAWVEGDAERCVRKAHIAPLPLARKEL